MQIKSSEIILLNDDEWIVDYSPQNWYEGMGFWESEKKLIQNIICKISGKESNEIKRRIKKKERK